MIFEMTEKQYQLFLHVMQVMQTFYGNNFSSICKEVGDAYGVNDVDIEKAYMIFTDFKVTAPVPTMQNAAGEIYQTALAAADIEAGNKETPYTKRIDMNESAWVKAAAILDAYSRILMGQFSIIYEVLDIADTDNKPQLQAYHDARWGGIGIAEARDLLIPQLRKLRVGWNGNFGISNAGLAYNSKLAYEMLKAILYACRQGDGTVLKVTDEPLMYAPGKSNIHALQSIFLRRRFHESQL